MRLNLEFPADTCVLKEIGTQIKQAGSEAGFTASEINDILLAVDEACTNTIRHGLKENPKQSFQLQILAQKNQIEILIRENGVPFNPEGVDLPDFDLSVDDRPIGGLGIYIMRNLMDTVEFKLDKNDTKLVRMVKKK